MNPGLIEEAGSAARTTIDALKTTPVILSIVIFNVLFILSAAYLTILSHERWKDLLESTMKYCLPAAGLHSPS